MSHRKIMFGLTLSAAVGFWAAYVPSLVARAGTTSRRPRPRLAPTCKLHGKKCCDPAITAHLPKERSSRPAASPTRRSSARTAARRTPASTSSRCANEKEDDTYVQVYAPTQKEVLPEPNDPFFGYKKVGKVYVTEKAKSPKSAPMLAAQTGLYMPGKGYSVSVNASVKVCTKAEAKKLAPAMK